MINNTALELNNKPKIPIIFSNDSLQIRNNSFSTPIIGTQCSATLAKKSHLVNEPKSIQQNN